MIVKGRRVGDNTEKTAECDRGGYQQYMGAVPTKVAAAKMYDAGWDKIEHDGVMWNLCPKCTGKQSRHG